MKSAIFIFMHMIQYGIFASNSCYIVFEICVFSQAKETDSERTQAVLVHIQGHHNLLLQES